MSIRRMMLFTLGAYVQGLIDAFKARVASTYGIFEAEACLKTQLDSINNKNLLQDATIIITPNAYNENILHMVKGNLITAPYNLSEYTEDFINIQSNGLNNTLSTTDINPFGVAKSLRMISNTANSNHRVNRNSFFIQKTSTYTFSIYLKKGIGATAPDVMQVVIQRGGAIDVSANFNLITGVTTNPINCTSSINNTGLTSGWWRCSITLSINAGTSISIGVAFCNNNPLAGPAPIYIDAITSDAFVFGFQIEDNILATIYQPILFTQILEQGYAQHIRSTTGYRVESTGLVREVPQENLFTYSENFIQGWNITSATLSRNNEIAPDGSTNAVRYNVPSSVGQTNFRNGFSLASLPGTNTFSFYVKSGNFNGLFALRGDAAGNTASANFTFSGISLVFTSSSGANYISNTITSLPNNWYRVSITFNVPIVTTFAQDLTTFNPGTTGYFLIWGAQLNRGNLITYYPTISRTNTPRLDYTDGSCPTILLEQSSTNVCLRSEEFNNASWIKSNVTVTPNTLIAPNGLIFADTLTANTDGSFVYQSPTSIGVNLFRISSIYIKRKTGTGQVSLEMGRSSSICIINSSTWTRCYLLDTALSGTFSVTSGATTVTTSVPHNLITGENLRFQMFSFTTGSGTVSVNTSITVTSPTAFTFTSGTSTATGTCLIYANTVKIKLQTSGDEVYVWGGQLETASNTFINNYYEPTSYIPTTTATATRGADSLNLYKIRGGNLLNNTFSLFWEVKKIGGSTNVATFHLALTDTQNSVGTNSIFIGGVPLLAAKRDNGVTTTILANTTYQPLATNYYKGLLTCNNGIIELWIDGSKLSSTTFVNYDKLLLLNLACFSDNGIARFKSVYGWNRVLNRNEIDLLFEYPYFNAGYTPVNNELQQVINRANSEAFTIPSVAKLGYCDVLITAMKNDGAWNITDVFFNFAFNDITLANFARINWKNPYGGLGLIVNTVNYSTRGYAPDGVTGYINTNFNPALATYNYTLNNAGRMFIIAVDGANERYYDTEVSLNGANAIECNTTTSIIRINSANTLSSGVNSAGIGLKSLMRDSSTVVRFQNAATLYSRTQTSTAITNSPQGLGRIAVGSAATFANYWMGASLTNSQIANFRTYYNTFLVSNGLTAFA